MDGASTARSPLASAALAMPDAVVAWGGLALRLLAAAAIAYVAVDQSYTGTRVFAAVLAAVVLVTCVPVAGPSTLAAGLGAGCLFFGGALLWSLPAGPMILVAGAAAGLLALAGATRRGNDVIGTLAGFFGAFPLMALLVVVVVVTTDG